MTNPVRRELSIGQVQYQGQQYEAFVVYAGDAATMPASFQREVGRVKEIYRLHIVEMLADFQGQPSALPKGIVIKEGGIYIDQQLLIQHRPGRWEDFINYLNQPENARVPPTILSNSEYEELRSLYETLLHHPTNSLTEAQKALLQKLRFPVKSSQEAGFEQFRLSVVAAYLQLARNV